MDKTPCPVLYFLSGLTCNHENFVTKVIAVTSPSVAVSCGACDIACIPGYTSCIEVVAGLWVAHSRICNPQMKEETDFAPCPAHRLCLSAVVAASCRFIYYNLSRRADAICAVRSVGQRPEGCGREGHDYRLSR